VDRKLVRDMTQQERHLHVLKLVVRKETLCDARLTRHGVLNRVWDEICNDMGVEEASAWADKVTSEIANGNHD